MLYESNFHVRAGDNLANTNIMFLSEEGLEKQTPTTEHTAMRSIKRLIAVIYPFAVASLSVLR
jgi:hypothetical protein